MGYTQHRSTSMDTVCPSECTHSLGHTVSMDALLYCVYTHWDILYPWMYSCTVCTLTGTYCIHGCTPVLCVHSLGLTVSMDALLYCVYTHWDILYPWMHSCTVCTLTGTYCIH